MKTGYRLIHRGCRDGMFYCVDDQTGRRTSLHASDENADRQISTFEIASNNG